MNDVDHGRRAEVLTKVADQLLEQLTIERRSNDVMRELIPAASRPMSASRRRALAVAAAVVAFVVPIAIVKLSEDPPPPPIVATIPVASPTVKTLEPLPAPSEATLFPLGPPGPAGADEHRSLTADQVREVVRAGRSDVERCYERAVRARQLPMDDLRLTVSATVEATGHVSTVHVTPAPAPFRSCIIVAVHRWQFPRSAGRSMPAIPFVFTHTTTVATRP